MIVATRYPDAKGKIVPERRKMKKRIGRRDRIWCERVVLSSWPSSPSVAQSRMRVLTR